MSNEIKVSISCITYNHENYIRDALDSFLMQNTNFDFEVLVHDDASTDNTQSIISEYQDKYPTIIKPIYQVENKYSKGERVSFKYNVSRAKGEYIAFCEGDDFWTDPNKLQIQVDFMDENEDCSMCFHAMDNIEALNGKKISVSRIFKESKKVTTDEIIEGGGSILGTNTMLYRAKYMKNPPYYYLESHVGDFPIQVHLSTKDYAFFIDRVMSVHRVNVPGSWTASNLRGNNVIEKRLINYEKDIKLLNNINDYYKGKYSNSIGKAITERKCYSKILTTNYFSFRRSAEYQFFKKYSYEKRSKMILQAYFPKIFKSVLLLKNVLFRVARR